MHLRGGSPDTWGVRQDVWARAMVAVVSAGIKALTHNEEPPPKAPAAPAQPAAAPARPTVTVRHR